MQVLSTILEWSFTVLYFSYHLPKLWTDWFAHANDKIYIYIYIFFCFLLLTLTGPAQPSSLEEHFRDPLPQGDFTRDDSQRRFFSATQHCNVGPMLWPFETMSQQCCKLCCGKGRCCKSSRVISPSNVQYLQTLRFCFRREDLRNWPFESYSWQVFAFQYWWKGKMEFFSWFVKTLSMNTFVFFFAHCVESVKFSSP